LKCNERRPECGHCIKGKRICSYERFLKWDKHIEMFNLPFEAPVFREDYAFDIEDESIAIASEYVGGEEWYEAHARQREQAAAQNSGDAGQTPSLPPSRSTPPSRADADSSWPVPALVGLEEEEDEEEEEEEEEEAQAQTQTQTQASVVVHPRTLSDGNHRIIANSNNLSIALTDYVQIGSGPLTPRLLPPESPKHPMIQDALHAHFLQVFVEEMGSWMDTMNPIKYVS
jgi:hypothetical protein